MEKGKIIKGTQELTDLLVNLWLNHKLGNKFPKDNLFMLEINPEIEIKKSNPIYGSKEGPKVIQPSLFEKLY